MKKGLLYLLLFSYAVIIIKPVLPTLADITAHIFWYSKHIATVHYEHGKYHVHYEYAEAAKKEHSDKDANENRSPFSFSEHLVSRVTYHFSIIPLAPSYCKYLTPSYLNIYGDEDYPPPRSLRLSCI